MDVIPLILPEPARQFVDEQTVADGFATAAEYVRELVEAERRRTAGEKINSLLREGLQGSEIELTADEWKSMRDEADELFRSLSQP